MAAMKVVARLLDHWNGEYAFLGGSVQPAGLISLNLLRLASLMMWMS